jgi:NADH:ubiquinone reductase (non-electrogenic)
MSYVLTVQSFFLELAGKLKITLIEALPNVLPAFSKQLIDYTEANFKEQNIHIHTKTMVKEVHDREITVQQADGSLSKMPYGLLVWATGNTSRPMVRNLMSKFPQTQTVGRGLLVDDWLKMQGSEDIYVLGDAAASKYAPTAQVASQQGKYLARLFSQLALQDQLEAEITALADIDEKARKLRRLDKVRNIKPFHYSHQGSLA